MCIQNIWKPFTRLMAMNIHPKNKDALSGNLLVGGNSPDAKQWAVLPALDISASAIASGELPHFRWASNCRSLLSRSAKFCAANCVMPISLTAPLKSWCRFRTKSEGRRNILKSQFLILHSQFLIVNLKIGITHYSSESHLIRRFFVAQPNFFQETGFKSVTPILNKVDPRIF